VTTLSVICFTSLSKLQSNNYIKPESKSMSDDDDEEVEIKNDPQLMTRSREEMLVILHLRSSKELANELVTENALRVDPDMASVYASSPKCSLCGGKCRAHDKTANGAKIVYCRPCASHVSEIRSLYKQTDIDLRAEFAFSKQDKEAVDRVKFGHI